MQLRKRNHIHQQLLYKSARGYLKKEKESKLIKQENGFRGEVLLDEALDAIVSERKLIHIKDFLFEYDGDKECQIDNIIIANDIVYLFEVKYFNFDLVIDREGVWTFENGQLMSRSPLDQVWVQKLSLQQLFYEINVPLSIESRVIFMNPEQMIYGLPRMSDVLLSFQLKKALPEILKMNNYEFTDIGELIEKRRKSLSKYYKPVEIDVDLMKKGVVCKECFQILKKISDHLLYCETCNRKIKMKEALEMLYWELKILNPNLKLNSLQISKLSGGIINSSTVRKYAYLRD